MVRAARGARGGRGGGRGRGGAAGRGRGAAGRGAAGRGAAGRGGRGRGRGPRGARVGRGRRYNRSSDSASEAEPTKNFDVTKMNEYDKLFLDATFGFDAHKNAQEHDKFHYLATMITLRTNCVDILTAGKIRALAAAWARHDHELADLLLNNDENFGIAEVLKSLNLLDSGRKARAAEKKIARMKQDMQRSGDKGKTRIGKKVKEAKKLVHNYNRDKPSIGSVSGALSRHIKKWTRGIPAERLEFFALHLTKSSWTQLADLVHLNAEKDFPQSPWFLKHCYGGPAPDHTMVKSCDGMTEENVNEFVKANNVPFAHLKPMAGKLDDDSKARVAKYTPDLDTILWDYELLKCPAVDTTIVERLDAGEKVTLPYGKLMERLLVFRKLRQTYGATEQNEEICPFYRRLMPQAELMLKEISLPIESPVVVIGDASASMDVAIQTSTIIASFLTALTNAELVFFSHDIIEPKFVPSTVEQVLDLAMVTKTVGSTANAAGLGRFYMEKKVVKTFIMCTDEEENTEWVNPETKQGYRFQSLFEKYRAEVYPAELVFVSFLRSQHSHGQMFEPMKTAGLPVQQFKLDQSRPDLTKLNNLVGQLSRKTTDFDQMTNQLADELRLNGLVAAFDRLKKELPK